MVFVNEDIRFFLSDAAVSGIDYLGGARTNDEVSNGYLHNIFTKTSKDEAEFGITKFRCIYVYNANPTEWMKNPIAYIISDTDGPNDYAMCGWGTAKIGTGQAGLSIEQTITDENTQPTNVNFTRSNVRSFGAILNADIPPLQAKALWLLVKTQFGAQPFPYNKFVVRVKPDNLVQGPEAATGTVVPPVIEVPVVSEGGNNQNTADLMTSIRARVFAMLMASNMTGDNNPDPRTPISLMERWLPKLQYAFGSNDVQNPTTTNTWMDRIAQKKNQLLIHKGYTFKQEGNLFVVTMDTSGRIPYDSTSEQYNEVKAALQAANNNPVIDWIVVKASRSMYAPATSSATRFNYPDFRDTYHQIFTDNNVIFFIAGGWRYYHRSKPVGYNPTTPANPIPFDYDYEPVNRTYTITGKGFPDGPIMIHSGLGGAGIDVIDADAPYTAAKYFADYGYFDYKVDNVSGAPKSWMRGFFYNILNKEVDNFIIKKV